MHALLFVLVLIVLLVAVVRLVRVLTSSRIDAYTSQRWVHPDSHRLSRAGELELQGGRLGAVLVLAALAALAWPTSELDQTELDEEVTALADTVEGMSGDEAADELRPGSGSEEWSLYPVLREEQSYATQTSTSYQAISWDGEAASCLKVVVDTETDLVDYAIAQDGFC